MTTKFPSITLRITTSQRHLQRRLHDAWPTAQKPTRAIKAITTQIKDTLPNDYKGDISVFASNEAGNIAQPVTQGFLYHLTQQKIVRRQPSAKRDALLYVHFETAEQLEGTQQEAKETIPVSKIEQIKEWQKETIKSVIQAMADTALNMEAQTALRGALSGLNKLGALLNQTNKQRTKKATARTITSTLSDLKSNLSIASTNGTKPPTKAQLAIRKQLNKLNTLVPSKEKPVLKAAPKPKLAPAIKGIVRKIMLRQVKNPRAIPIALAARNTTRIVSRFQINRRAIVVLRITQPMIASLAVTPRTAKAQPLPTRTIPVLPRSIRQPRLYNAILQPTLMRGMIAPREALRAAQTTRLPLTPPQYRYDSIRTDSRVAQANVSSLPDIVIQTVVAAQPIVIATQQTETQAQPITSAPISVQQTQLLQQQDAIPVAATDISQPSQSASQIVSIEAPKTSVNAVNNIALPATEPQRIVTQEIHAEKNDATVIVQQAVTAIERNELREQHIDKPVMDIPAQQAVEKIPERILENVQTQIVQSVPEKLPEKQAESIPQQPVATNIINLAEKRAERDAVNDANSIASRAHTNLFTDNGLRWNATTMTRQIVIEPLLLDNRHEYKRPVGSNRAIATGLGTKSHEISLGTVPFIKSSDPNTPQQINKVALLGVKEQEDGKIPPPPPPPPPPKNTNEKKTRILVQRMCG